MLFVVMLGGRHPKAHIEVHDVVFAWGECLQATYPQLRAQWFGTARGVHVDSWLEVHGVDGWQVRLSDAPAPDGAPRLFLINLGGYAADEFGEAHRYVLVVATDKAEAKRAGKRQAARDWALPHSDAVLDVDDCIAVDRVDGRHVVLQHGAHRATVCRNDYLVLP